MSQWGYCSQDWDFCFFWRSLENTSTAFGCGNIQIPGPGKCLHLQRQTNFGKHGGAWRQRKETASACGMCAAVPQTPGPASGLRRTGYTEGRATAPRTDVNSESPVYQQRDLFPARRRSGRCFAIQDLRGNRSQSDAPPDLQRSPPGFSC